MDVPNVKLYNVFFCDAAVLENTIVFFGGYHGQLTYLFEKEKHSPQLKLTKKLKGINQEMGQCSSQFCKFQNAIYLFPHKSASEVLKFDLTQM